MENNFAKSSTQAGRSELQQTYQAFSPDEKTAFNTLAQNVTDRYAAYVDSGMSHNEAVAQVRVELQQMIDSEHQPTIRPIAANAVFNGLRNAPALFQAARVTLARLNDIILLVRAGITLDQLLEKKPQSGHGGDAAVTKGTASGQGSRGTGGGLPDPEEPKGKHTGTRTDSTELYNKDGIRIDVENPNPNQRPGQIHIQNRAGNKFYYDSARKVFYNQKTGELAAKSTQKLLEDPKVMRAIEKGEKILGVRK